MCLHSGCRYVCIHPGCRRKQAPRLFFFLLTPRTYIRRKAEKTASGEGSMAATAKKALENAQTLVMELAEEKPIVLAVVTGCVFVCVYLCACVRACMCIKNKQSLVMDLAEGKSPFTCKDTLYID